VASAEIGAAKPDRAIFERALELAGADAREAWHVGDSADADVAGALAAGLRPVLLVRDADAAAPVGSTAPDASAAAAPTISSLAALPALIGA
jgi:putative hydrolase of the HAD superfamily